MPSARKRPARVRRGAPLVLEFLSVITILPLTSQIARRYAEIRAALEAKGWGIEGPTCVDWTRE
jgi:predicted nucleic acid-binding protein